MRSRQGDVVNARAEASIARQEARIQALASNVRRTEDSIAEAEDRAKSRTARVDAAAENLRQAQREELKRDREAMAAEAKRAQAEMEALIGKTGNKTWSNLGEGRAGKPSRADYYADLRRDNSLATIQKNFDSQTKLYNEEYTKQKKQLDAFREAELKSQEDYYVQNLELSIAYEDKQHKLIADKMAQYESLYGERRKYLEGARDAAKTDVASKRYTEQMDKELNALVEFQQKLADAAKKLKMETADRIETVYLNLAKASGKLILQDKEFWNDRREKTVQEDKARELERLYNNVSESIFSMEKAQQAAAIAQFEVTKATDQHLVKLREELRMEEDILKLLQSTYDLRLAGGESASTNAMQGISKTIGYFQDNIARIRGTLSSAINKGAEEGVAAAAKAFDKMREEQALQLRNALADAIVSGIKADDVKSIGRNIRKILMEELAYKPLTVEIRGVLSGVTSALVGSYGSSNESSGGMSQLFGGNTFGTDMWGKSAGWIQDKGFDLFTSGAETAGSALFNFGSTLNTANDWLKTIPGFAGGMTSAFGYAGAVLSLTEGNYGAAAGTAIGTYVGSIVPVIGTAVGGAIGNVLGGFLDGIFGSARTKEYGGSAMYSAATGAQTAASHDPYRTGFGKVYDKAEIRYNLAEAATSLGQTLDGFAKSFGQKAGYEIALSFASDFGDEATWGGLRISQDGQDLINWNANRQTRWAPREFASGDAGYKEYLTAVALDVKNAMLTMDLPGWAKQLLNAAHDLDTVNAALQQIGAVKAVFKSLASTMEMFSNISGDMESNLLYAFGSLENLTAATSTFYEKFYSEQERMDILARNLAETLSAFDITIDPSTGQQAKDEYRKLVETAMADGDAALAAALMSLSGTFSEVADAAQAAADTLEEVKTALEISDKLYDLHTQLLRTQGYEVQAVNRERAKEIEALQAYGQEAVDLQHTIWALADSMAMAKANAESLKTGTKTLADAFATAANEAASAMQSAGSLLDRISEARGGSNDTYAKRREQRLWDAMATASYKQQITLAEELTNIVIERAKVESETAQKLIDMSKRIQESIDSMKLGELSPLTLEEKLAEAIRQFNEAVTAAQGGDTEAASKAIDLRSTLLGLGQRYYASSDLYTELFNSTELSLQSIAGMYQSQGDAQSAISQASLAELGNLRAILEAAYAQAELDYAESSVGLKEQLEKLASMDGGISLVADILGGLPVELAAALQPLMQSYTDSQVAWFMRDLQMQNPGMMLSDLQSSALANGATASQVSNVSGKLYSDAEVKSLYLAGKQNYPYYTDSQLVNLAAAQYGIPAEQAWRVINGSHANGLSYVPYNNYVANLHQGELVLPERQASIFRSMEPAFESMANNSNDEVVVLLNNILERIGNTAEIDSANAAMLAGVIEDSSQRTERAIVKGVRASGNTGVTK